MNSTYLLHSFSNYQIIANLVSLILLYLSTYILKQVPAYVHSIIVRDTHIHNKMHYPN